jgi:hypothetical protein
MREMLHHNQLMWRQSVLCRVHCGVSLFFIERVHSWVAPFLSMLPWTLALKSENCFIWRMSFIINSYTFCYNKALRLSVYPLWTHTSTFVNCMSLSYQIQTLWRCKLWGSNCTINAQVQWYIPLHTASGCSACTRCFKMMLQFPLGTMV